LPVWGSYFLLDRSNFLVLGSNLLPPTGNFILRKSNFLVLESKLLLEGSNLLVGRRNLPVRIGICSFRSAISIL